MTKKSKTEETPAQKSAEEVAAIYISKFESIKSIRTLHTETISAELIENIRKQIAISGSFLERLTDKGSREISEKNKKDAEIERQKLDNGGFSVGKFNSIAKDLGVQVREGFLRSLGTKFLNKIPKRKS